MSGTPETTLGRILEIIDLDTKKIQAKCLGKKVKGKQLPPEDAMTLARYASALSGIIDDAQEAEKKKKRELDRLPTDELVKRFLSNQQTKPNGKDPK